MFIDNQLVCVKIKYRLIFVLFTVFILSPISIVFAASPSEVILLQDDNFEHIEFGKINANHYVFHDQQLQIDVDSSASFLMKAFNTVRKIHKVSFAWRSKDAPQIINSQHEAKRKGDDAVFKLGLLLKSDDSSLNPFLPSWMKRVESLLKFPSQNMIYLVADAKHAPGRQWPNPYNKRVTMISISSVPDHKGWMQASYQFEQPVNVVALWLMADGDNTKSKFTAGVKNVVLE